MPPPYRYDSLKGAPVFYAGAPHSSLKLYTLPPKKTDVTMRKKKEKCNPIAKVNNEYNM